MKRLLLLLPLVAFSGENGLPDWEYDRGAYSVNQAYDDPTRATLVGPEFPYGIRLEVAPNDADTFQSNLILIVDRLARKPHKK